MKALCANNYFYLRGGAERVFFDEMQMLARRGVTVVPYSQRWPENERSEYARWFMPGRNHSTFAQASLREKVRCVPGFIYSRAQRRRFTALLSEVRPDIVHGHNIYGGLTPSIIDAAKRQGVAFVLTLHDLKLLCPSCLMLNHGSICELCMGGRPWHCLLQRCHKESLLASAICAMESSINAWTHRYDWVRRFLAPSHFLLEKHVQGGFPREKLVYLPNALDPNAYEPDTDRGEYVLFAGRLSHEKGILTLLRAFRGLPVPLKIAGKGSLEDECHKYAAEGGLNDVEFCGHCQSRKLAHLYRRAAFVVVPSECYENAPMSILEAFAHGKPVLGSNLGGIPELVLDEITGRLFQAGVVEDLREKLLWMWGHRQQTVDMGRNARRRIETDFSVASHVMSLLEVYRVAT